MVALEHVLDAVKVEMARSDLPRVVRRVLRSEQWKHAAPRDINEGDCEDFQQDVIAAGGLDGSEVERVTSVYPGAERLPGHCWIEHEGRHYDAEVPDGVDDWQELPIFVRARRS